VVETTNVEGMQHEIVMPRGHYIAYTPQWGASGGKIVEYGQSGSLRSFKKELISVINDRTCCSSFTLSYNVVPRGIIPLDEVVEVSKKFKIPVVVDAASMLPQYQIYINLRIWAWMLCVSVEEKRSRLLITQA